MRRISKNLCLAIAILAAILCTRVASADEAPLFEQEPFDTIKLDDENKNVVLKVQPLDLPNRHVPAHPNPTDELDVRLLDRPRKGYKLTWEHIAEVKLFERMVLDDAEQLTATGKFDEAYPYYEFLQRRYPKMAELAPSYEKYLLANAGAAYKQQRYEESLGVLWELFDRNPDYKGVTTAIQRIVGKLFDRWLAEENYVAARGILREASARLKDQAEALVSDGNQRLQKLAADRLAKAKTDFQAGQYAAARRDCQQSLAAWPEIEGGAALAAAMRTKYPLVEVGVTATAAGGDAWGVQRDTRLLTRSLSELTRLDRADGVYDTPLLKNTDLGNRRLSLTIKPGVHWPGGSALTAADLSRTLLAEADPRNPSYRPQWARLVAGVTLHGVDRVDVELQQPIDRADPWLDVPMWRNYGPLAGRGGLGPYAVKSSSTQEIRYLAVDDYFAASNNQSKEILERLYPNIDAALAALRHGDVQVVDRLGPFEAESLKSAASVVVEPYAAPTVHLLVFNLRRPIMNNATFRRALAHVLDRESILNDNLLRGVATVGSKVTDTLVSQRRGDASGTAELRYDPATAQVLMQVALSEGQAARTGNSPLTAPALPTQLILEHPADEAARMACLAIQRQFHAIGLTVTLREPTLGAKANPESPNANTDADIFYVEWSPLEPVVSLNRLLAASGGGSETADLLAQLSAATSAGQTALKPAEAEHMILEQTLLIPLWQLTDYVAYRRELHGIGRQPITLFQNVEQWQLGGDDK